MKKLIINRILNGILDSILLVLIIMEIFSLYSNKEIIEGKALVHGFIEGTLLLISCILSILIYYIYKYESNGDRMIITSLMIIFHFFSGIVSFKLQLITIIFLGILTLLRRTTPRPV